MAAAVQERNPQPPHRNRTLRRGVHLPRRRDTRPPLRQVIHLPGDARDRCGRHHRSRERDASRKAAPEGHQPQGRGRLLQLRQPDRPRHHLRARDLPPRLRGQEARDRRRRGRGQGREREAREPRSRRRDPAARRQDRARRHRRGHRFLKEHTESSIETCGSEVQKGNAPRSASCRGSSAVRR